MGEEEELSLHSHVREKDPNGLSNIIHLELDS